MRNVVTEIVAKDLCSSCGVCAGLCPSNALTMSLQENGNLVPSLATHRCQKKCALCLDVCPFSIGMHNPRERNEKLYGDVADAKFNDDIGWHARSIVGFRKDESLRKTSASGGLATWFLEILLNKELVTRVAVVRVAENHDRGFFEFYAASSVDELRKSSGSFYHPVEISEIIKEILSNKQERWAIVGVPCLCAAVRNSLRLRDSVPFVFGMACGMYQNTYYTEMLLSQSGVDRTRIQNIEYRRKSDGGSPSDYRFRGTDNRGPGRDIPYHGLPFYLGKHAFFRLNACNFCMDVFAETADACCMDAWLPKYSKVPNGTSLVVLRSQLLVKLILEGKSRNELELDDIHTEDVVQSQRGQVRRKRKLIYMRSGVRGSLTTEDAKPTIAEKVSWWLEKRTQNRSKRAWARFGRNYGSFAFWLVLCDLLLVQNLVRCVTKIISFPNRLYVKLEKAGSR